MADTIKISDLPAGTPTSSAKVSYVDPLDGVTKVSPYSDFPIPSGIGNMLKSENLSGLTDYTTARSNLGLGTLATQSGTFTDKEDTANKSTSITTDQASNTKFPSVKSVYDWAVGAFATLAGSISQAFSVSQLEVGHASDTTISRVSPGVIAVEGVKVPAIAPSTSGNIMTSNGTDWVSSAPLSGSEWTLIETLTPSAVTSFDSSTFTAYDKLRIEFSLDFGTTSTFLRMRVNTLSTGIYNFINYTSITLAQGVNITGMTLASSATFTDVSGEIIMDGKGNNKPLTSNIGAHPSGLHLISGIINTSSDITQINMDRSSGTGTFTGTVNIYGKNY